MEMHLYASNNEATTGKCPDIQQNCDCEEKHTNLYVNFKELH